MPVTWCPELNFTIILQKKIGGILVLVVCIYILGEKEIGEKVALKMLMKLTPEKL